MATRIELENILKESFLKGLTYLLDKDKKRLRLQGHYATGRLERSLKTIITLKGDQLIGEFSTLDYGIDLDTGVPAHMVNYTYQEILDWAKIVKPDLSSKEVGFFAAMVWRKHRREGIPTKESIKYSKTGERLNWIKRGTELAEKEFERLFDFSTWFLGIVDSLDDDNLLAA